MAHYDTDGWIEPLVTVASLRTPTVLIGGRALSFLLPQAPATPPPPAPPTMADASIQGVGAASRAAAAAASGGMGFNKTLKTGSLGADQPATATKTLLGA